MERALLQRLGIAGLAAGVLHATFVPLSAMYLERPRSAAQPTSDLRITELTADDTRVGGGVSIRARVRNTGLTASPEAPMTFWLSRDGARDDGDLELGSAMIPPLDADTTHKVTWSGDTSRPDASAPNADGPWFVVAATPEHETAAGFWVQGDNDGDLVVQDVELPEFGVAGGAVALRYTLHNAGSGWLRAGWTDVVLLSRDAHPSPDDLELLSLPRRRALGPGTAARTAPLQLWLPRGIDGVWHVVVVANADRAAIEPWTERNAAAAPLAIEPSDVPDLTITEAQAPDAIATGVPVDVSWDVMNFGTSAAVGGVGAGAEASGPEAWVDAVYLSRNDRLDDGDARLISVSHDTAMPGGGLYRGEAQVVLPAEALRRDDDTVAELWHLIFVTDAYDHVNEGRYEFNNTRAVPFRPVVESEEPPEPTLGKDDVLPRLTVAWIDFEAFEELQAKQGVTYQPAAQAEAKPTPDSPLRPDGGQTESTAAAPPPSPTVLQPGDGTQTAGTAVPTPPSAAPDTPFDASGTPAFADAQDNAGREDSPAPNVAAITNPVVPSALPTPTPAAIEAPLNPERPDTSTAPPNPPSPTDPAAREETDLTAEADDASPDDPTATPQDASEADASDLTDAPIVRPGKVEVGEGLELTVARPRFSSVSLVSTVPRSPVVTVTFDTDGTVIDARIDRSTGAQNFDGPILASLYRWKAQGEQLADWERPRRFTFTIILDTR